MNNNMNSNMNNNMNSRINITNDDECSFCLEKIDYTKNYTITKCYHKFHFHCISKILERYNKCPLCNRVLNIEKIELNLENSINDENEIFLVNNSNKPSLIKKICNFIKKCSFIHR
jgi:hypothetical protein